MDSIIKGEEIEKEVKKDIRFPTFSVFSFFRFIFFYSFTFVMVDEQGESTTDEEKLKAGGKLNFVLDENVTVIRGVHRSSKGKVVGVGITRSSKDGRVFVEARAIVNLCGKSKKNFYHFKDSEIRTGWLDDLDELDDNSSKSPIVDYIEYKDIAFWVEKEYEEERLKESNCN